MKSDRIMSLEAIYNGLDGPTFMTGIQALVRLPLMQRRLDRRNGHNTAGLISGYRGSPLGGYDQQLWRAQRFLDAHDVVFQPGLNEDLAATALWGAQMHRAYGPAKVDGVFGVWYGKGPGVDRTGDVFREANMLGVSPLGGVLAVAGDDHAAQSSTFPHQTDGIFQSAMIPIIQPANVSEILSLGLAGFALSRFSGLWVAMKTITEVVENATSFTLPNAFPAFLSPQEVVPAHGLNWDPRLSWPAQRAELERRMIEERQPAVLAWARANQLDRPVLANPLKRICFVTVGKAHQDLMQAFEDLELSVDDIAGLGLSVYKVAMSWPLDTASLIAFAEGFDEIVVIEEKAPIVEAQLKTALYEHPADRRPRVSGKTQQRSPAPLPVIGEFSSLLVAGVIVERLSQGPAAECLAGRLDVLKRRADPRKVTPFPVRKPFFCAGCPHNTSTRTPDGSISAGGIGCHGMALSMPELKTDTFCHMGGEGAQWIGAAPFSETGHLFQNLGDGTYQHSGLLAIRAAIAAGTTITYKILYNDAVAMTGGQPTEGAPTPATISRQLAAEGVAEIRLVCDEPEKWHSRAGLAPSVSVHHRDELDAVQRDLRGRPGVTAIIYDQTCAAEKRRRRKRKEFPDPDRRLFINARVCEGCGDCSAQSNCIAIEPLATEFGVKRRINQSSCNKDFSCVKGFCPSFVELDGPVLRKPATDRVAAVEAVRFPLIPEPALPPLGEVYNIYVAGIGGLGVLTLGALLGAAAYLDGAESSVLDFTGLAQKNGAVVSQVRIAPSGRAIHAARIGAGAVDLMLATDSVVAAMPEGQMKLADGKTAIVLNRDETPTADAVRDRNAKLPTAAMIDTLFGRAGDQVFALRATALAEGLFGDAVAGNVMLLGYAWQKGLVPLSLESLIAAINANGAAVAMNTRALSLGRLAAVDLDEAERMAGMPGKIAPQSDEPTAALVARRLKDLTAYQNAAYGQRYQDLIDHVARAAGPFGAAGAGLVRSVAVNAYRLMAYKDEYEVARLYAEPKFRAALEGQFSSTRKLSLWLAPPLLSRTDPRTGRPAKRKFGPWIFPVLGLLSRLKVLRGTPADPLGMTSERRLERWLRDDYFDLIARLSNNLTPDNIAVAIELAELPDAVRGYGPVKAAAVALMHTRHSALMLKFEAASLPSSVLA